MCVCVCMCVNFNMYRGKDKNGLVWARNYSNSILFTKLVSKQMPPSFQEFYRSSKNRVYNLAKEVGHERSTYLFWRSLSTKHSTENLEKFESKHRKQWVSHLGQLQLSCAQKVILGHVTAIPIVKEEGEDRLKKNSLYWQLKKQYRWILNEH